jgi:hypothetical protein
LRQTLQQAVSCVTTSVIAQQTAGVEGELSLLCRLAPTSGAEHITLALWHYYAVVSDTSFDRRHRWQARTTAYFYRLDGADGREIIAYHWHPSGRSPSAQPHLHIGAGAGSLRTELHKAHLGTGFVTPVPLLSLLLESFAVRPQRVDWATVLETADDALSS